MLVVVVIVALAVAAPVLFVVAGTRPRRRLPDSVRRELEKIPMCRWNQHFVDLELKDGRVVEGVWTAYGKYVALIGGRMRRERYRVDDVLHARYRPVNT